jgi:pilus assembly protein Flp/PilA
MFWFKITALRDEEGQALVEYALIIALISLICVGALTFVGNEIDAMLSQLPGF